MSQQNVITQAIAEKFLKDEDSVDLTGFTSIEDDAAQALAQHKGELWLNGLTSLSDGAAQALAQRKGDIELCGLTSLSDGAAQALAQHKGDLYLSGLKTLSGGAAQALAQHKGVLSLDGLTSLSDAAAQALAQHEGNLSLDGLTSLSDEAAQALAQHKGRLELSGLTSLSDGAAQALAQHKGDLYLSGLTSFSDGAAQALLCFNGVRLICGEYSKKLLQGRRKHVLALVKAGGLKTPTEWQNGRIVLPHPPAMPMKGGKAKRTKAGEASWWLPKKVCDWFVQKLDDAHKALVSGYLGYGSGKSTHISPEAAELLRSKSVEWMSLMEEEVSRRKTKEAELLQSLGKLKVPKEFQKDRIVIPAPANPVAESYCWKPDFEGEDYQSVLHYYEYLPAAHVGSVTDPDGYRAKAMSPEAAELYRRHRTFWEAKHLEAGAQAKAATVNRQKAVKEQVAKAAASAGMSKGELRAKLDRLSELAAQDNLQLACDMIAGFEEAWLFEVLLAGAAVEKDGTLKPGKELKRFKGFAEVIMLMCLAYLPEGTTVDGSLSRKAKLLVNVDQRNFEVLLQTLKPLLPSLKITESLDLDGLTSLSDGAAQALAQHEGNLSLDGLTSLSDAAAQALAQHEGHLSLDGLTSLSDAAAQALAQHEGNLSLDGLTSLSDGAAQALAQHKGDLDLSGLTSLSDGAAQALAQHKGRLELNGLTSLSDAAVQALAQHKGELRLSGGISRKVTLARKRAAAKPPQVKARVTMAGKAPASGGSVRRLEYEGGGSAKFWESEVRDSELVVRFGRLGTDGQEKIKAFPDAAAAAKEQAKLIKEKLGKGYKEV
jgi:predicted DNA-binding WGR domain protein